MDEPIITHAADQKLERLVYDGNGTGVFISDAGQTKHYDGTGHVLSEWFAERGHRVEVLPNLLIFRATGQPYYPPSTAFAGETVVWDSARKFLYVASTVPPNGAAV